MNTYPLKFRPIYKERIWGAQKLRTAFAKDLPAEKKIGESWELADLPQDKSVVSNGLWAGQSIDQAVSRFTESITGCPDFPEPFPLLIKLLDAQDVLSVQVHPDAEACERMGQGDPKTECWYIIDAEPGACIYKGLKPGVTRDSFAQAIQQGTVEQCLIKLAVQPGECHFLPAGTAHAIGAGLLIAEIQLPSDTTYRVFDWNRTDDQGQPRELHIKQALQSIHFDASGDDLSVRSLGRLVDCDHFKVDKGHRIAGSQILLSPGNMETQLVLSGRGSYTATHTEPVDFRAGDCLLIPASYEGVMQFEEESEFLRIAL